MKIKIFHVAERYHFYDGVHHAQVKPYIIWKILETGWKKSVVVENVSPIAD